MTFDPMQNRIQTRNLMADELAALKAAKHGWQYQSSEIGGKSYWRDMDCTPEWHCGTVYRAKPAPAPTITFTPAELLAAAAELPEVQALVEAAKGLRVRYDIMGCGDGLEALAVDAALAPFARKGE